MSFGQCIKLEQQIPRYHCRNLTRRRYYVVWVMKSSIGDNGGGTRVFARYVPGVYPGKILLAFRYINMYISFQ
jgi:hypothetical protein